MRVLQLVSRSLHHAGRTNDRLYDGLQFLYMLVSLTVTDAAIATEVAARNRTRWKSCAILSLFLFNRDRRLAATIVSNGRMVKGLEQL